MTEDGGATAAGGAETSHRPAERAGGSNRKSTQPNNRPDPSIEARLSAHDIELIAAAVARHLAAGLAWPTTPNRPEGQTLAVVREPEYGFEAFCLDAMLDTKTRRPGHGVLGPATFANVKRALVQVGFAAIRPDGSLEVYPPRWDDFKAWVMRHPKRSAGLENQRYAMAWLAAYFGVEIPEWASHAWDSSREVASGQRAGRLKKRVRFFDHPSAMARLVAADVEAHPERLNCATFRAICYLGFYTGPRSTEPAALRLGDVDLDRGCILWPQPKKGHRIREVQPPEPYALRSMLDPSLEWYLTRVRPRLDKIGEYGSADSPLFLFFDRRVGRGRPWQGRGENGPERAFQQFMSRGMHAVLGDGVPAGHAFRRACVTYRLREGWTLGQVAAFVDDTQAVVERSYIDRAWLNVAGIKRPPRGVDRPLLPRLRMNASFGVPDRPEGPRVMK